jgi:phosphatidylglycerol:prolipoprotein diacylglycerol transferase
VGLCPTFFMLRYLHFGPGALIPSYNFFVGIGMALAMLYLQYQPLFKLQRDNEKYKVHLSLLVSTIGGFAGAFLFDAYAQGINLTFENINQVGLTFFGGLVSGLMILIISLKLFSLPLLETLNILTLPFCIGHFFGRLGCFMAGCCYGSPTNGILGVVFPKGSLPYEHYHELIKIHPTQLYESFFVLSLFVFLIKAKYKNPFYCYLISYAVFRFLVEFLRSDNRGTMFNQDMLSPSQMISVLTMITCIGLIFINRLLQTRKTLSQA